MISCANTNHGSSPAANSFGPDLVGGLCAPDRDHEGDRHDDAEIRSPIDCIVDPCRSLAALCTPRREVP